MTRFGVLLAAFGIGLAGWQGTASANVNNASLTAALLAADQCAVEVELQAVVGNQFNGNEQLLIGATILGTFSPLVGVYANLSPGDRILFATAAFAAATGLTPDITIAGTICALMVAGAVIQFNGSFGPVAGSLTLPTGFVTLFAASVALGLIDLATASLILYSLTGDVSVGTGDPVGPGGGGCTVAGESRSGPTVLALFLGAFGLATLRRRRRWAADGRS